MDFWKYE
jgi:hypothetical protein